MGPEKGLNTFFGTTNLWEWKRNQQKLICVMKRGKKIMTNQNNLKEISIKLLKSQGGFEKSFDTLESEFTTPSQQIFFNTCFDKNHLKTVIAWFLEQYGEKVTVDLVETLKQVGFNQATRAGVSLGLDDLKIPPQKKILLSQASVKMNDVTNAIQTGNLTSVEKCQRLIDTWNQTSETLRQTAVQNFRTTNPVNPVYMMAFSGARGNISQVRQLVAMRGLMADPQGAILEFPIQSNFREGLTVTEYLISCYGARKGLVDTALRTATSGYLTRRLVDAVQHVVVNVTDCQTQNGIIIKDKNLEQRLVGRVLFQDISLNNKTIVKKNTLISQHLSKQIASQYKAIVVRSPLTCQTEKSVCQLCYGLDLSQGKLVSLGEAVGIIAAQSIGEPGTQLTMRTFHTGGVGVFSDQAMKSFTAPFEGKVEFLEPLSGLFVRTPQGNIVYLLKHKTVTENKPILRLTSIPSSQKSSVYQIMHSDVPAGSLLWVKQGEFVKSGQLLLQASRLQTATQEMPESSHPVRASLSGEVFFQSMAIRIVEEEKRILPKTKKKKQQNPINSQINQKEISPKFPTLIELGNFWVFSTFVQKEDRICNSFFLNGDLLSPETPIQQYNLHLQKSGQLKSVKSDPKNKLIPQNRFCEKGQVVLAHNSFEVFSSTISYSGLVYFLKENRQKNKPNLLSYTANNTYTLLTWYPFFKTRDYQDSGYCCLLGFDSELSGIRHLEFSETLKTGITQKQESWKSPDFSYIWSPHSVVTVNRNAICNFEKKKLIGSSSFIFSQDSTNLSQKGLFQFAAKKKIKWNLQTQFAPNLIKNVKPTYVTFEKVESSKLECKVNFIKTGLSHSKKKVFLKYSPKIIKKNQVWTYIPQTHLVKERSSQLCGILLEPGKKFENLRFDNSYVAINALHPQNLVCLKLNCTRFKKQVGSVPKNEFLGEKDSLCKGNVFLFYSSDDLLNKKVKFQNEFLNLKTDFTKNKFQFLQFSNFSRNTVGMYCFYNQKGIFKSRIFLFKLKRKRRISQFLLFQKVSHKILPTTKFFKQNSLFYKLFPSFTSINSPLFSKQNKTSFIKTEIVKPSLKIINPTNSGWFSFASFLKVELQFNRSKCFQKTAELKNHIFIKNRKTSDSSLKKIIIKNYQKIPVTGFNLFFYQTVKIQNSKKFHFQTFPYGWVFPDWKITDAFLTSKKLGEFRFLQTKQQETALSILRNQDSTTLRLPVEKVKQNSLVVGTQVRWGREIFDGFTLPVSGQIIKTTLNTLTLRKGIPLLASIRGLVHISHNDLVQKNDLLITLRSRRLQTEDIVQGIPKIEQLFEARETQGGEIIQNNMHNILTSFFNRAKKVRPIREAVQLSLSYIQKFLVENILEAYSNQGVNIAEKHVEVVVRQMTARVRITNGGDTGFLPGEFVQLRLIEKVNFKLSELGRRPAHYEPIILGITKSVLQSESFLLAASFQQVSKVLVRSALAKKTDFLRGLHENILVGQPIPAGTGIIGLTDSDEKFQEYFENKDFSNFTSEIFPLDSETEDTKFPLDF